MTNRDSAANAPGRFWPRLRMRLFHLYFLASRPMTLGVRALVHDRQTDSVLLVRHTYVDGWHLPGGGVEPGETALTALKRELAEEANIEIEVPPVLVSVHHNRRASRRDHVLLYRIDEFRQTEPFVPTREIAEARFFGVTELPSDISPSSARRIAEVMGDGGDASSHW